MKLYRRMFETKGQRPYYSIPHIEIASHPFKELVGVEYDVIDVTSADMTNEGYAEVNSMNHATEHFRKFWEDDAKVMKLLEEVRNNFKEDVKAEEYGWKQDWKSKSQDQLILDMNFFYGLMFKTMARTIISQPQHVLPLDEKINMLLENYPNRDELFLAATYHKGDLPWVGENKIIENLHKEWSILSKEKQEESLDMLVEKYGWFNEIEGDTCFNKEHYRKLILSFKPVAEKKNIVEIPKEIIKVGQLIAELGFLRFWSRYHFMTLRFHLKNILRELKNKSKNVDLEYATIDEINDYFSGKTVNFDEIRKRVNGYVTYLENGKAKIVTGNEAENKRKMISETISENISVIKGIIANKGIAKGKVRVISFSANNYNDEVAAFTDGEILVTGMTRPQIVHLCKKALAIVTDEGGITSHAAVVSREFGIPCIIATHNATRILRTGDMVEVDANIGIVKILK